jgi:uncharacterized protein
MKPIVLTHTDFDGICSAEILRKYYKGDIEIYPINHGEEVPYDIIKDRDVYVCDFSFKPAAFSKVVEIAKSVVWLDHHKSALDEILPLKFYKKIKGIQSTKYSGCELVWAFCYNNKQLPESDAIIPEVIRILGRYDTWHFKNDTEKQKLFEFQYGLKTLGLTFGSDIWADLLKDIYPNEKTSFATSSLIKDILRTGKAVNDYHIYYLYGELNKRVGRTIKLMVNGRSYSIYAMNAPMTFSESFITGYDENIHDCCLSYYQRKDGKWQYSVYVQKDKDIDGSVISKSFGGGGHVGASGFQTDDLLEELR